MASNDAAMILAELATLRLEVRAIRAAIEARPAREKTPRQVRAERREALLRELAEAVGLTGPWARAGALVLIVAGTRPAPQGFERHAERLRNDPECPRSQHGIFRHLAVAD